MVVGTQQKIASPALTESSHQNAYNYLFSLGHHSSFRMHQKLLLEREQVVRVPVASSVGVSGRRKIGIAANGVMNNIET